MSHELLPDGALEVVVVPPTHSLGDNFTVRRALPSRQKRMVGPFVFLDQMGPHVFAQGHGLDVRPHPHMAWPLSPIFTPAKSSTATASAPIN